jgi:hypothetical protein
MIYCVTNIANGDLALLPHWLRHYMAMPIDKIILCVADDQGRSAQGVWADAVQQFRLDSARIKAAGGIKTEEMMGLRQHHLQVRAVQAFGCKADDWLIMADLDEFYEYPESLAATIARLESTQSPCQYGFFADMISTTGELAAVKQDMPLIEQFPVATKLTEDLLKGGTSKVMVQRACLTVSEGHHQCRPDGHTDWPMIAPFGVVRHYKWKAGLVERLKEAMASPGCTSERWKGEAAAFLAHLDRNGGKINVAEFAQ